jgi:hypothetical protein
MSRKKLNTKFEFPAELNLEPYTEEGLKWRAKKEKSESMEDLP